MKPVVFLPSAEEEIIEAAVYYQAQAEGLGTKYLNAVEKAVRFIAESPTTWPVIDGSLRRHLVRNFPFGILYRIEPEQVVIVAVAHMSRRPGYWQGRK